MKGLLFIFYALLIASSYAYVNPVQGVVDSPDPGVIYDQSNDQFFAATTGGWNNHAFPIWVSKNLVDWKQTGWGLSSHPHWTTGNDFWAPEIHIVNKKYVLYYTARTAQQNKLCIGAASSFNISGPYIDIEQPLFCQTDIGVIDATYFQVKGGKHYLVYKTDGNDPKYNKPTEIYARQLSQDGLKVIGDRHFLFRNSLHFQGPIVEAPWVIFKNSYFYVFYSANGFWGKDYSVGVARSKSFLGPYEKLDHPILHTANPETSKSAQGPGHCSVLELKNGKYAMIYHAWPHGKSPAKRYMMLDMIKWENDWPYVGSPSENSQPNPLSHLSVE